MFIVRHVIAWFRRARLDDELREEMAQHVAWKAEGLVADGVPEAEARRRASLEVGNVTRLREESRAIWGFARLDSVAQDVRYAFRQMRRAPVVAAVAVASLAIAIGAGTAVFDLAQAALYREGGIIRAHEVLTLRWHALGGTDLFHSFDGSSSDDGKTQSGTSFAYAALVRIADALAGEADVAGYADIYRANLSVEGEARMANGQLVSASYFSLLGVRPALGRLLGPADDNPASDAVVVGHHFWTERLGGRADAIGRALTLNGSSFTVVGVTPEAFQGSLEAGTHPDVYVPFGVRDRIIHDGEQIADAGYWWVRILVRPRADVGIEAVRAKSEVALRAVVRSSRDGIADAALPGIELLPGGYGDPYAREGLRDPLRILFFSIAALLFIACVNVAGLQVARAAAREREMGVRLAMGAGRGRLLRQVITESVVLALTGGVTGLFIAAAAARALLPALQLGPDAALDLGLDWRIAAFAIATALLSGVLLGLAPAWRASGARASIVSAASLAGRGSAEPVRLRLGRSLLVCQMALSLALVYAALLFVQSHRRLAAIDPGFDTRHLAFFSMNPLLNGYSPERVRDHWMQSVRRVREIPGVSGATITTHPLIANSSSASQAYVRQPDGSQTHKTVYRMSVGDDFFTTMGIAIRAGRPIDARDTSSGVRAAVVNETMARTIFGQPLPLGAHFRLSDRPNAPEFEVVGVAADARYSTLRRQQPAIAYLSLAQNPSPGDMTIYMRSEGVSDLAPAVRAAMREVDPTVPIFALQTQEAQIERYLAQPRFFATLGMAIGGVTLLLACIGLYGLMSYSIARRTTELGVRLALGARPHALASGVMKESLALAAAGVALGVPAAYALGRAAATSLFSVPPASPGLMAAAALVLAAVAAGTAFLPARRASRVDPLVALKSN